MMSVMLICNLVLSIVNIHFESSFISGWVLGFATAYLMLALLQVFIAKRNIRAMEKNIEIMKEFLGVLTNDK